jgi:hypothetical protein
LQVEKASIGIGGILHDFLNLFLRQDVVFDSIVRLNNDDPNTAHSQKVSHLQYMRGRRMLAVTEQPTRARVSGKSFRRWDYPKMLGVRRDQ